MLNVGLYYILTVCAQLYHTRFRVGLKKAIFSHLVLIVLFRRFCVASCVLCGRNQFEHYYCCSCAKGEHHINAFDISLFLLFCRLPFAHSLFLSEFIFGVVHFTFNRVSKSTRPVCVSVQFSKEVMARANIQSSPVSTAARARDKDKFKVTHIVCCHGLVMAATGDAAVQFAC